MGAVIVLTPIIITAWPMIAAAVSTAAVSAGFKITKEVKARKKVPSLELSLENSSVVGESLGRDDELVVEREGVRVVFSRDAQGHFKTTVEGNLAHEELKAIGEDLAGRVVQQYVYRRIAQELGNQGFETLDEEKGPDETIRLHVRRYPG
jgi:hypothetical protein